VVNRCTNFRQNRYVVVIEKLGEWFIVLSVGKFFYAGGRIMKRIVRNGLVLVLVLMIGFLALASALFPAVEVLASTGGEVDNKTEMVEATVVVPHEIDVVKTEVVEGGN
jgi:hypothetical protein